MKERSEIEEKYKWDLSPLESDLEFNEILKKIKEFLPKFTAFEGKLDNKANILKYLALEKEFEEFCYPIDLYLYLKKDECLSNNEINEKIEKLNQVLSELAVQTAFASTELHNLSDQMLDDIISDERFKNNKRDFEIIKKSKKHTLSKAEEKLLAGMDFLGGFSNNMRNISDLDLDYGEVENSKGEKLPLNQSIYSKYIESQDRTLRKNAFKQMHEKYGSLINTFAGNYISEVKANCYFAKVRNYPDALSSALEDEEVDRKVYDTLIKMVNQNLNILFDYFEIKQKELGLDELYVYDTMATIEKGDSKTYSYDEAIELIKKAVAPLGEEYVSLIQKAKDERWIDVFPNKGKRSGAYQTGIYGYHPYILADFEGDLDSVFTLAHEFGHAMHSYYSDKNQPREMAGYCIFLAEIASTTNEILLMNYLLSQSKDNNEKRVIYDRLFDYAKGVIFRQTMFAEFEEHIHSMHEKGEGLTKDKICDYYYSLSEKYFGFVKLTDETKFEWARIPHFFAAFYVYKYATGMISAINFANRILSGEKGAVEDYFKFLSAGASDIPTEILKNSGCDLTKQETFEKSFDYLKNIIIDWKNI